MAKGHEGIDPVNIKMSQEDEMIKTRKTKSLVKQQKAQNIHTHVCISTHGHYIINSQFKFEGCCDAWIITEEENQILIVSCRLYIKNST